MNKIALIISREYLTRVKKRSFVIMTILGPLIFAGFLILPAVFSSIEDKEVKTIAVVDSSHLFIHKIPNTELLKFEYINDLIPTKQAVRGFLEKSGFYAVVVISPTIVNNPGHVSINSFKQPSRSLVMHIENSMEKELSKQYLLSEGIDGDILRSIQKNVDLKTIKFGKGGEESTERNMDVVAGVGYIGGFIIYFFIFLFGAQVMRGVVEEKTNRIVEVIISSVRPFQLMMGKIIGIGLVALTQFAMWLLLTFVFSIVIQQAMFPNMPTPDSEQVAIAQDLFSKNPVPAAQMESPPVVNEQLAQFKTYFRDIDFGKILGSFLFYFLGGYLLYASLFAIIGAASNQDTETQQFMMPVTIPLILGLFVMFNTVQDPESSLAFWFSLIPFTSPIVMMARVPFDVPLWERLLSMAILVATFMGTTWMAGKVYRTGILMYGKKITYKELWKWIKYKV